VIGKHLRAWAREAGIDTRTLRRPVRRRASSDYQGRAVAPVQPCTVHPPQAHPCL